MKKTLLKLIVLSSLFLLSRSVYADTITGRVIKSDGKPVAKAEVSLKTLKAGKSEKSQTDREGRFSFKDLETGYYALTVSAENLCSETLNRIEVNQAKYGIKNYEVALLRPWSINGYVYD